MAHLWHKAITGVGGPPFILENLSPSTITPFLKQNLLERGDIFYVDELFTLTSIPSGLLTDGRWIMTANNDKGNTATEYLSFDVDRNVTVYVAYDSDPSVIRPDWLTSGGFVFTGFQLGTSNPAVPTMDLYSKDYLSGEHVILGGNQADGATGAANYIVIVIEN
jgi:hypothetical protein